MRWSRNAETESSLGDLLTDQVDDDPTTITAPVPEAELRPGATTEVSQPVAATGDAADDDFLDDEDYLPQERSGPSRLTVALVAAVVLAVGVLGGVWVDKQFGTTTSAAGARAGGQAMPGGMPGGGASGMPGGGASGMPGGGASGMPGGAASAQPGGSSTGSTQTPVVVGVVTSTGSGTLVVTDLGGKKHSVTVSTTTTLTMPYAHSPLKSGDTVSISGTTDSDGTVTATGVTVR